jgi:hypothetical protein
MQSAIQTRAMLVTLKISQWSARKYDRKISAEVASKHNAGANAGRYTKNLLPQDSKAFNNLGTLLGELRGKHYAQTLAWSDEGWRLLPYGNHAAYSAMIRDFRSKIEEAKRVLGNEYPALRAQAKVALNGMFRDEDYPSVEDLLKKYTIKVDFAPIPDGNDYRVQLDAQTLAEIARDTDDRVQKAVAAAQTDAVDRLREVVGKMTERLSQPDAIFRDSLIENAREVCDVLTRINVTEDADLEAMRQRVEDLARVSPDTLRTLPHVRKNTAAEADRILAEMSAIFGTPQAEVAHA